MPAKAVKRPEREPIAVLDLWATRDLCGSEIRLWSGAIPVCRDGDWDPPDIGTELIALLEGDQAAKLAQVVPPGGIRRVWVSAEPETTAEDVPAPCACAPCYHAELEGRARDFSQCHNRRAARPGRLERAALGLMLSSAACARGVCRPLWAVIGERCGLGSGSAAQLCRDLGFDPDTGERL